MNTKNQLSRLLVFSILFISFASCKKETIKESEKTTETTSVNTDNPLPSWNDGKTKDAIINYVKDVITEGGANFIPVSERIATFDNDGTLWSEQPVYFELFFALDRIKAMAKDHPEWKDKQPFKAVLENNMGDLMKQGEKGLGEIMMVTHTGMTGDEFDKTVKDWMATAQHPIKKKAYNQLVYQPMLELVNYLKANDFKVFIVSGGGVDFMRAWAEDTYGIPKNQIVGSSGKDQFDYNNGNPVIKKLPALDMIDDKEGKPVGIYKYIGRKPVFAAGNSDGDLQMLQYAASNKYKNFELYVHHTDSVREWAYDRKSHIGTFDKGLDFANEKGWTLASMKDDWKVIYPFELKK